MTPAQLTQRRHYLGASEVAAVLGKSPYATPADVLSFKLGAAGSEETPAMRVGTALEPIILSEWSAARGIELDVSQPLIYHPQAPWLACHPDGLALPVAVEAKTYSERTAHEWDPELADGVPIHYLLQCQTVMACTGASVCYLVAAEVPEDLREWLGRLTVEQIRAVASEVPPWANLHTYEIRHHPGIEAAILTACGQWWQRHVVDREPLPPDGSAAYSRLLAGLNPPKGKTYLPCEGETAVAVEAWRMARAARKSAEEAEAIAAAQLKTLIGSASGIQAPEGRITWSRSERARTSWREIAQTLGRGAPAELARLVEQYTSRAPVESLRAPRAWGGVDDGE